MVVINAAVHSGILLFILTHCSRHVAARPQQPVML